MQESSRFSREKLARMAIWWLDGVKRKRLKGKLVNCDEHF